MKIIVLADTHNYHEDVIVPDGDILIYAGDMCGYGDSKEAKKFGRWFSKLPHDYKVVIAGNHDQNFYKDRGFHKKIFESGFIHYLEDRWIELSGIKIYGSPWQPEFCDWAFNLPRGEKLKEKWDRIPEDTDILVTHTPPAGILDQVSGIPMGCADLLDAIHRVKPKYHIFGHIHNSWGVARRDDAIHVNCSICDDNNIPENEPLVIDYERGSVSLI